MTTKRDHYLKQVLEDSSQSFREHSSMLYQIPMSYKDYQEMKESSTRTSSRPGTNYTNQSATNLKVLTDTEESTRLKSKNDNFDSIMTPIFNNNPKGNEPPNAMNYAFQNKSNVLNKLDTSRDQEERYRKLIESAFQTVDRLKTQRERLVKRSDQITLIEEEISRNSKKCLTSFNEKHKRALDQLEKNFYNNVTKVKDLEAQKKDYLKDKLSENKNYIQELSTLINALDAKIQMEPMSVFIQTYEDRYFGIDKLLSQLPQKDIFFEKEWREFPTPPLDLDLDALQQDANNLLMDQQQQSSERRTVVKGGQGDTLLTNRRGNNNNGIISSNVLREQDNNQQQNIPKNQFDFSLRDKKPNNAREQEEHSPLRYLQAVDLNTSDNIPKTRNRTREDTSKDYFGHRQSVNPERKFDEDYLQNPGRFSYSYQNEGGEAPTHIKTARIHQEGNSLLTERNKGDNKIPPREPEHKSQKYKEKIKKLEQETKHKDKVIKDLITSYKDLEDMVAKTARTSSRSKTKPDVYDDVLKSTNKLIKPKANGISPRKASKKEKRLPSKDTENIKPADDYNETYEVTKTRYKYLRGSDKMRETNQIGKSAMNQLSTSGTTGDLSRNKSIELQKKRDSKNVDISELYGGERGTFRQRNTANERPSANTKEIKEDSPKIKVRVYVPSGDTPYSQYHMLKVTKQNTVNDLLERLLEYIGVPENKFYKYYVGVRINESSPEKIMLASESLKSYIDKIDDKKSSSWPKFYLRTYSDKSSEKQLEKTSRQTIR